MNKLEGYNRLILLVVSVLTIGGLEALAIWKGVDGAFLLPVVAIIAYVAGRDKIVEVFFNGNNSQ